MNMGQTLASGESTNLNLERKNSMFGNPLLDKIYTSKDSNSNPIEEDKDDVGTVDSKITKQPFTISDTHFQRKNTSIDAISRYEFEATQDRNQIPKLYK